MEIWPGIAVVSRGNKVKRNDLKQLRAE